MNKREHHRQVEKELLEVCRKVHWQAQGHLLKDEISDDVMICLYLRAGLLRRIASVIAKIEHSRGYRKEN